MMNQQKQTRQGISVPIRSQHARIHTALLIGDAYSNHNLSAGERPRSALSVAERIAVSTRAPVYSFQNDVSIWRIHLRLLVSMFDTPYVKLSEELGVPTKKIARWINSEGSDTDNLNISWESFEECIHCLLNIAERAKYLDRLGYEISRLTGRPYRDFPIFAGDEDEECLSFPERMKIYDELITAIRN
jgi:hypothetical protein